MGADIHYKVEVKNKTSGAFEVVDMTLESFENRWYGLFGWLADVRNYSELKPIAAHRGKPEDSSLEVKRWHSDDWDFHSWSWVGIPELISVNYEEIIEDRRCTIGSNGGATAPEGQGQKMPLREFLDYNGYFTDLERLRALPSESRIVFCFDS